MQPSIAGFVISALILAFAWFARWNLTTALLVSLAFGSTAIGTLTSLGGSSPLIFTIFCALLIVSSVAHRGIWWEIGAMFGEIKAAWVVCALVIYAVVGALLFPRLFAGQTSVFVASRTGEGVYETALAPVSLNVSQAGYFVLSGLTFFAICLELRRNPDVTNIRRGFFLRFSLTAAMGLADLMGKMTGLGDVLAPIRSATYVMLTNTSQAGFWRIAGAYSEASAFGGTCLVGLAFNYTYWRRTRSKPAFLVGLLLFLLLLLSTSSTAYVGLAIISVPACIGLVQSMLRGRLMAGEMVVLALIAIFIVLCLGTLAFDPRLFRPVQHLFDVSIVNKLSSSSGHERTYWNVKSIQSFFDTSGMGVGLGSSRASSWIIAVLSQLGIFGTILMCVLILLLAKGLRGVSVPLDSETVAVEASVRATTFAGLTAGAISAGYADPGLTFMIALATTLVIRSKLRAREREARASAEETPASPVAVST